MTRRLAMISGITLSKNSARMFAHLRVALARRFSTVPPAPPRIFFVRRSGGDFAEVAAQAGASVASLKEAAAAKLRVDAPLDTISLLRAAGGGTLDARLSIDAAGLVARDELLLTVCAPPLPPLATFSGVIARAAARLDGAALRAFAAPSTRPRARLDALGALVAELVACDAHALGPGAPLPLLHTQAHMVLLDALVWHARALVAGTFVGVNGLPCRTLIGARGIGKTAMLRAFCAVAPSAFPSLAVLYTTGEGIADSRGAFRDAHLRELIEAAVAERALSLGAPALPRRRGDDVDTALDAAKLRAFVVLDEVDELYRVPDTNAALVLNVNMTLGALATLGGSTAGRFGIVLCGSSAATPRLVCGDGAHLADRFPLVQHGIPNLNSHKFKPLRIPSAPCSAVREVAGMLATLSRRSALPRAALPSARLITFFVGASPRAVAAAVAAASLELGAARPTMRDRTAAAARGLAAAIADGTIAMASVSSDAEALYGALLARLVTANADLRSLVGTSSAAAQLTALLDDSHPWESTVVPLVLSHAATAWEIIAAASPGGAARARDAAYVARLLDELADGYWLHVVRADVPGGGGEIWPMTAAHVVFAGDGRRGSVAAVLDAATAVLTPAARLLAAAQTAAVVAHTMQKSS